MSKVFLLLPVIFMLLQPFSEGGDAKDGTVTFFYPYDPFVRAEVKEMISQSDSMRKKVEGLTLVHEKNKITGLLDTLSGKLHDRKTIYLSKDEIEKIRAELNAVNAAFNMALFADPGYFLWESPPYSVFSRYALPPADLAPLRKLDISMACNEYLATAFMITNTSDSDESFRISIPQLKDSKGNASAGLTVRYAYFLLSADTRKHEPCVLPSLEGTGNSFMIPKGQTGQVWFTIRTNKKAAPGIYSYLVKIELQGKKTSSQTLPLNLTIKPFAFPEKLDVDAFTYAYIVPPGVDTHRDHFWDARTEALQDLREHYESICVFHAHYMPLPKIEKDSGGRNIVKVDFSQFDKALELHRDSQFFLFLWGGGVTYFKNFAGTGYAYPSPEWKALFFSWLAQWIEHIKAKGLGYNKFAMYPLDEKPADPLYVAAKSIKEVDPKVKVYATLGFSYYSLADLEKIAPYVDMMCISTIAKGEKLDFLKKEGKTIYPENQPNPSKGLPPYTMRWTMWKWYDMGLNGSEAWAYNAASDSNSLWDDFAGGAPETFVYDGKSAPFKTTESIIPSKQWEAWREGLQDWQYLKILEKLIGECRAKKVDEAILKESESLLKSQVQKVIDNPLDASLAEKAKEKILEEIIKLRKALK